MSTTEPSGQGGGAFPPPAPVPPHGEPHPAPRAARGASPWAPPADDEVRSAWDLPPQQTLPPEQTQTTSPQAAPPAAPQRRFMRTDWDGDNADTIVRPAHPVPQAPQAPRPSSAPTPAPEQPAPAPAAHSAATPTHPGPRKLGRRIALAGGGLCLVAVLAGGGYLGVTRVLPLLAASPSEGNPNPAVSPVAQDTSTTFTRATPPGWGSEASWAQSAALASPITVRHGYVAYMTGDGVMVVLNSDDGSMAFSSAPAGIDPAGATVSLTTIGGDPFAVASTDTSVLLWNLAAGELTPATVALPDGARVTTGNGTGLLVTAASTTQLIDESLALQDIPDLPKDNVTLGLNADGAIISGARTGGWSIVTPTGASDITPAMPAKAAGKAVYPARAARGIVVAWSPTDDPATRAVALYDGVDGTVLAQTTIPTSEVNLGLSLSVDDDGTRAALGGRLANLETGEFTAVDSWKTTIVVPGAVFGTVGDTAMLWTGEGEPVTMETGTALPWGVSEDGSGIFAMEADGDTQIAAISAG